MKIQIGQELLDIIHRNKDAIVVGTGWIGQLMVYEFPRLYKR